MKKVFLIFLLIIFSFSFLFSYKPVNLYTDPFGVAYGGFYDGEQFMNLIRDLGVNRTKVTVFWHKLEPEEGKYRWDVVDKYVSQLKPGDNALIGIFTTGYCTTKESFKGSPLKNEHCKERYRIFIKKLVKRTKGLIKYWQRDTEPASNKLHYPAKPEPYVETQKIFYKAVKEVQPDAIVVGVNNNGTFKNGKPQHPEFFDYVIKYSKDYYDLLDVRLYEDMYTIRDRVKWFRDRMKKYGYEKPIISTEFGGPDPRALIPHYVELIIMQKEGRKHPDNSGAFRKRPPNRPIRGDRAYRPPMEHRRFQRKRVDFNKEDLYYMKMFQKNCPKELEDLRNKIHFKDMVQRHLIVFSNNVKAVWLWDLSAPSKRRLDPIFGKMRFMNRDTKEILPPYYAYKRMIKHIGNLAKVQRIETDNNKVYLFKLWMNDGSYKFVVWERRDPIRDREKPPIDFSFEPGFKKVKITDVFEKSEIKETDKGKLELKITDTPLYIEKAI